MHPLPLTGTETSGHLLAAARPGMMHPLPLLGTETPTPPNLLLILLEASPTPHGDGNPVLVRNNIFNGMHPLPLAGTAKKDFLATEPGNSFLHI